MATTPPVVRFFRQVRVLPSGCWKWLGYINERRYPQFSLNHSKLVRAHRFAWEWFQGRTLRKGMTIDHLCRNRWCVRPLHLDEVTMKENTLRSPIAPAAVNARKTKCKRGHPLSGKNLRIDPTGRRICRRCKKLARDLS